MIVVGGEALVDLVRESTMDTADPADTVDSPNTLSTVESQALAPLVPRLGGGPFTTAVACGRLGTPTAFLSRISTDAYGQALCHRLTESTVDTSLLARADDPTSLAVVGLGTDRAAGYSFYMDGTADRFVPDPGPLPAQVTVLSVGSIGVVLEPGASAYEAVLRRESARGVLTVLDPNIRPSLIADPAAYRSRFTSWLPHVRVLKLSDEDAAWLSDTDDPARAAARWAGDGPDAVLLTAGERGIRVFTPSGQAAAADAVPARVADTIGAGDTVHAALLCRLHAAVAAGGAVSDLDAAWWTDTADFAVRAAAVTVSRPGADPPWAAEIADV